jgi:hypothetical protein
MFACIGTLNEINNFEILVFYSHQHLEEAIWLEDLTTINCIELFNMI